MTQTLNTIRNYPGMEEGMTTTALNGAVAVIRENLPVFTEKFQSSNSFGGFYEPTENVEWTTGFWTGSIWLAYEHTGDEAFKKAADIQVESFLERIEKKIDVNHHDMGFLYSLSCVAAYKLTGNEHAKRRRFWRPIIWRSATGRKETSFRPGEIRESLRSTG